MTSADPSATPSRGESLEAPSPDTGIDFQRMRRQLARSVARVCPTWLAGSREDIVQAALLQVLGAVKKREHNSPLPASFLWRVAYTATIDQIRRVRRRREVPLEEPVEESSHPAAAPDPHRSQIARELGRAIDDCLQRLQERRRLVVGFFLLGHSLAESERLTGWNGKKVRNLLYRGLADLRTCLAAKGLKP